MKKVSELCYTQLKNGCYPEELSFRTTAELEPDPMYHGPKLFDPRKCRVCEKMCPTGAIPPYVKGQERVVEMGDRTFEYSSISWNKEQEKLPLTPLLAAMLGGHWEIVRLLRERGADCDLQQQTVKKLENRFQTESLHQLVQAR